MRHHLKKFLILVLLVACSTEIKIQAPDLAPSINPSPETTLEASPMASQIEPKLKPSPSPDFTSINLSLDLKLVTSGKQAPVGQTQVKLTDIEKTEISKRTDAQGHVLFSGLKPGLIQIEVLSEVLKFESKELVLDSNQQLTMVGQESIPVAVDTPMPVVKSTPKPVISATPVPIKTPIPTVQVPIFLNPAGTQPTIPSPSSSPTLPQEDQIQKVNFKLLSSSIETKDTKRYLTLSIGLEISDLLGQSFDFWPWEWLSVKCKLAHSSNTLTTTVGLSAIRENVLRLSTEALVFDKMLLSSFDSDKRLEITCDLTASKLGGTQTQKLEAKQELDYLIPSEE